MDWKQAIRDERAMLLRIVSLLLSLADLAERACHRSSAVCAFIYFILRPAEMVACEFAACPSDMPLTHTLPTGDVRADLLRLAWRLRELACLLKCAADRFLPEHSDADVPFGAPRSLIARIFCRSGLITALGLRHPMQAHDTS